MVRPAENMPLTKWHGSEGKFCYKMIPFVTKMSPQRGHGSTHSIAEIGTGIQKANQHTAVAAHVLQKSNMASWEIPQ